MKVRTFSASVCTVSIADVLCSPSRSDAAPQIVQRPERRYLSHGGKLHPGSVTVAAQHSNFQLPDKKLIGSDITALSAQNWLHNVPSKSISHLAKLKFMGKLTMSRVRNTKC